MVRRPQRSRGGSAYAKEVLRSITGSLSRFLAIMGIVALGCGFFAGLQMSGRDMRLAADAYYDQTNLWDLRVISTSGLGDAALDELARVEGVSEVMGSRTVDAVARVLDEQVAIRITAHDFDAMNVGILKSGRWPRGASECVVSADAAGLTPAIGDTIEVLYGGDGLDDLLATRTFTVVGTVSSSNYPYTGSFGSTKLGSGMIDQYLFVTASAFVEDAPYTEAYLTVDGARELESGSDDYEQVVDAVHERIDELEGKLASGRAAEIRADAQVLLDDSIAEYESQKTNAYQQRDSAKAELDDASAQIANGESSLADGERQYASAFAQYQEEKDAAAARLSAAQAQIDQGQAQLDARRVEWQAGVDALLVQTGGQNLADAKATLEGQTAQLDDAIAQVEALLAMSDSQPGTSGDGGEAGDGDSTGGEGFPETPETPIDRNALAAQLEALKAQRAQLTTALATVERLLQGESELAAGQAQLDASRAQLESGREEAARQLGSAKATLDDSRATLDSSRRELDDAKVQYAEGLSEWEEGRAEADAEFADAWSDIEDAQAQIDEVGEPDIYVLDRTQNEGVATHRADTERMDSIADVFPFIFFLVAALVALTTMTRTVEDERVLIGTFKALGYSKVRIAGKYVLYALVAAGIGAVIGIAVLSQVLPLIIMSSYAIIYAIPDIPLPLPVDPGTAIMAGGLGVGVTLAATFVAATNSLREVPAALMLPRAPKAGKRILLEHLGIVWRNLTFSWKVTFRNLFRYKRRFLMTVIGISGCTALLLVGFGLHDSIWDIIDRQYGPIVHYDMTVGMSDDATEEDIDRVASYLANDLGATPVVRVQTENMQAAGEDEEKSTAAGSTTRVSVVVAQDAGELCDAYSFRERVSGEDVAFGSGSVLLTEKLSILLGVGVGDKVLLFDQDAVGNATGDPHELMVTGIVESYVGNSVFVGRNAWASISDETPSFSTVLANAAEGEDQEALSEGLHDLGHVSTVIFSSETIDTYRSMLSVVDLVVVVLIVSAAALAFIVLYNLTNINVEERVREIASLKVLGFTRLEVYQYIFREVILLSVIGDVVGLFLGRVLENFVITTAEVDYVMFGRSIHPPSYVYAFALTILFTGLVLLIMRRKLDGVNMVESLKSVE